MAVMMKIDKSWHEILKAEIALPYIMDLKKFLEKEKQQGKEVYPPEPLIFHAFARTPWEKVRVVIMGQDPYHGPGQAHGLSFSVPCGIPQPPSLQNIFKEIGQEFGYPMPKQGCLTHWSDQGVLMLNATLTVRRGEPQSHANKGWEKFTDAVVAKLAERKDPIIFVLWGKSAQEKCQKILETSSGKHVILKAAHPSPYSAANGFFGCGHFLKINQALERFGSSPIDWKIP
jgi:uracil-DNA glycosylase